MAVRTLELEMKGWANMRHLFEQGFPFTQSLFETFSMQAIEVIRHDLSWLWIDDNFKVEEMNRIITEYKNKTMDEQKKMLFVKTADFEGEPRLIQIVKWARVKGDEIKAKFVDKWGWVCRIKFVDASVVDGKYVPGTEPHIYDSTAYGFAKAMKDSGAKDGDVCMIFTFALAHPLNPEVTYRKWIVQPVMPKDDSAQVVPATSTTTEPNAGTDNQDNILENPSDGDGGDSEGTGGF